MAMPPVVGAEKHREDIAVRDLELVPGVGEVGGRPAVVALVTIMNIGKCLYYIGKIPSCAAVLCFVGMVVEIGDAVADGHPGDGLADEGGEDDERGDGDQVNEFHMESSVFGVPTKI